MFFYVFLDDFDFLILKSLKNSKIILKHLKKLI